MMLFSLMLLQAAYSPETEAVMNRARREAEQARQEQTRKSALSHYLPEAIADRLQHCIDTASDDPSAGLASARVWLLDGGGFSAEQCLGFAYAQAERWGEATAAFDRAATLAQNAGSGADAARLWAQAGNVALAAGDFTRARSYFDRALEGGLDDGLARGETHLDRARALVALGDNGAARADIDEALRLAERDPLAWLLSAALARRMDDLGRAARDIAEAKKRAPDDASVALEAGKIAILSDDEAGARSEWNRVLVLAPSGEQAAAAREMLARLAPTTPAAPPSPPQSR